MKEAPHLSPRLPAYGEFLQSSHLAFTVNYYTKSLEVKVNIIIA